MKRWIPLGLSCIVLALGLFSFSQLISKEPTRTVKDSIHKGETYLFLLTSGEVVGEVIDCSDFTWIQIQVKDNSCRACADLPIIESWINLQFVAAVCRIDAKRLQEMEAEQKKQCVPPGRGCL
jgi:hypothetical protein